MAIPRLNYVCPKCGRHRETFMLEAPAECFACTTGTQMSSAQCEEFKKEVAEIINRMSLERFSNTPDFILAEHLCWALLDFNATMAARESHKST